ncbi:NADH dehydrogenase (ubiquinone) B14.7 subunit [Rhynchophorus ferrugineus]|uniref:NADH dehydrogenase [ubiquinone] 1 alpha subcomplex subunit 11 n=2 Tax=Rhynchophorus ferrugineus TaxID=354439 RepID=A0A834IIZ4_RHYFE|nr:hypothetical protein GWI33_006513 [Rhynchophorus ferrugineus]
MENSVKKGPYRYFDTPEGEDTFKKLWAVLKPTLVVAGGLGSIDVLMVTHPKGVPNTLGRYAFIGLPIVGIASTFVLTTNTLVNIRKKEDKLNWFLGGAAAGSWFGAWARKPIVGFNMALLCGFAAFLHKCVLDQGNQLIPTQYKRSAGGATACLRDFSLFADRPGKWTT